MKLSQKAIQRMISGQVGSGGGGGSSFDPSTLAGMATQAWVEDGYISKAFWAELFIIHKKVTTVVMDGTTEVSRTVDTSGVFTPNEIPETTSETDEETGYVTTVTTEINHIEFRKGAWSNSFISALGLNPSGGGSGSTTLAGLADVQINSSTLTQGQVLTYDGNGHWVNGASQSGISMSDVWTALAEVDNTKQIDYSHISSAVRVNNGTITIGTNTITPLTSLPVDGYDARYLQLTGGTLSINSIGGFTVKNTSSNYPLIRFEGNTGGGLGFIGIGKTGSVINPYYVTADANGGYTDGVSQWYTLLHTGNWSDTINLTSLGAASSSSVSTLQGYFTNGVAKQAARLSGSGTYTAWGRTYWQNGVPNSVNGNIDFSKSEYVVLKDSSNEYSLLGVSADNTLLIGWGIKGLSTYNTTLCAGGVLNLGYGSDANDTTYGKFWTLFRSNGHVTINSEDSTDVFLNVGGATKTTRLYLYKPNAANDTGAVYLEYNTNNAGIHLVGGGFYSDTYVSALGVNSGGGGGGSTTLAGLLDVVISNPSNGQVLKYNSTTQKWYNGTDEGVTSIAWNQITSKPNTISGYGITDAKIQSGTIILGSNSITPLTSLPVDGYDNRYLQLTGGTLSINSIGGFTVKNTSSNYPLIRFEGNAAGGIGFIGIGKTGSVINPYYVTADANGGYTDGVSQWYTLLHTGNWSDTINLTSLGAASSSSVSTLQGYFTNGVAKQAARLSGSGTYTAWGRTYWSSGVPGSISGDMTSVGNITMSGDINMQVGEYINMHIGNNDRGVLGVWGGNLNLFYLGYYTAIEDHYPTCIYGYPLRLYGSSTMGICIDISGNVGIGTTSPSYKLDVNGSIFGNTLNADTNLSSVSGGAIEGFHSIELNSYGSLSSYGGFIDFHYNGSSADYTARFIETNYGLVKLMSKGANGNDQRAALVIGEGYTSSYIQIGDIRLVCDSNHDLRVVMASGAAANLYATGGISALGMNAGTSSIDEMTFGYLNVNNELNFGSSAKIYMDDFFYIDSAAHVSVNGVEFENNNAHANRLYLGNSQYLYVSGGTLYYYNGSSSKVISS